MLLIYCLSESSNIFNINYSLKTASSKKASSKRHSQNALSLSLSKKKKKNIPKIALPKKTFILY